MTAPHMRPRQGKDLIDYANFFASREFFLGNQFAMLDTPGATNQNSKVTGAGGGSVSSGSITSISTSTPGKPGKVISTMPLPSVENALAVNVPLIRPSRRLSLVRVHLGPDNSKQRSGISRVPRVPCIPSPVSRFLPFVPSPPRAIMDF